MIIFNFKTNIIHSALKACEEFERRFPTHLKIGKIKEIKIHSKDKIEFYENAAEFKKLWEEQCARKQAEEERLKAEAAANEEQAIRDAALEKAKREQEKHEDAKKKALADSEIKAKADEHHRKVLDSIAAE